MLFPLDSHANAIGTPRSQRSLHRWWIPAEQHAASISFFMERKKGQAKIVVESSVQLGAYFSGSILKLPS